VRVDGTSMRTACATGVGVVTCSVGLMGVVMSAVNHPGLGKQRKGKGVRSKRQVRAARLRAELEARRERSLRIKDAAEVEVRGVR